MVNFDSAMIDLIERLRDAGEDATADHIEKVVAPMLREDGNEEIHVVRANMHAVSIIASNAAGNGDAFDLMVTCEGIAVGIAQYLHETTELDGPTLLRTLARALDGDADGIEQAGEEEDEEE